MNIFDLPLDALKTLCRYFPLMALFTLAEAVEPASDFVTLLREQILPERTSLTLLVGPAAAEEEETEEEENKEGGEKNESGVYLKRVTSNNITASCYFDLLHFDQLTVERAQWLVEKMPAVSQLTVSVRKSNSSVVPQITSLITAWSPRLADLSLYINLEEEEDSSRALHALLLSINLYCTWLRHLRVNLFDAKLFPSFRPGFTCHLPYPFIQPPHPSCHLDLPILGQLESFSFRSADSFDCLLGSLIRWAVANDRLTTLEIDCRLQNFMSSSFRRICDRAPRVFTRKFRRLDSDRLIITANYFLFFGFFVDAFSGLVELRLRLNPVSAAGRREESSSSIKEEEEEESSSSHPFLEQTFGRLARLSQLQKLELIVPSLSGTFHWRPLKTALQLPSVRSLTLTTVTNSHYDLSYLAVHRLFPRLEHFTLAIDERIAATAAAAAAAEEGGRQSGSTSGSLNHFHCHRCKWWAEVLLHNDTSSSFDRCTAKAFRCLKRCAHLKTARLQLSGNGSEETDRKPALSFLPPGSYKALWVPQEL